MSTRMLTFVQRQSRAPRERKRARMLSRRHIGTNASATVDEVPNFPLARRDPVEIVRNDGADAWDEDQRSEDELVVLLLVRARGVKQKR